jgi:hypothetical protein
MTARGAAIAFALLSAALAAALAATWLREGRGAADPAADLLDATREEAIERLVAATSGVHDSHPDADVSKILLPSLQGALDGKTPVDSNRFGLREADWQVPKPAGVVRVVVLGDSFVFGMGVAADQRLGVHLQRELAARAAASPAPAVEVLHVGIVSWSLVAECSFLRRQLALLQPNLVVHHVVPNDLDDTTGVRGFGMQARSVPRRPEQADAMVSATWGRRELHPQARGLLAWAQDGEGRARLDEAAGEIARLHAAVRAAGARYLLLVNWHAYQAVARQAFAPLLAEDELAFLPSSHYRDQTLRISEADEHWSPAGHEDVARVLYGALRARGLLPQLELAAWPEAEDRSAAVLQEGYAEAFREGALERALERQVVGSEIVTERWTPEAAGQVHTGIYKDGMVSPFACFVLARGDGTTLRLAGRALERPELDGARVDVLVDGHPAGSFTLQAGRPIDFTAPLPEGAAAHDWLAVRLQASDFAYDGDDLRRCISLHLERAAIER